MLEDNRSRSIDLAGLPRIHSSALLVTRNRSTIIVSLCVFSNLYTVNRIIPIPNSLDHSGYPKRWRSLFRLVSSIETGQFFTVDKKRENYRRKKK